MGALPNSHQPEWCSNVCRWVLRAYDAPPDTPRTAAAKAEARARAIETGDDEYAETLDWTAGETLMMAVEAVDEMGVVDTDFDAVVRAPPLRQRHCGSATVAAPLRQRH